MAKMPSSDVIQSFLDANIDTELIRKHNLLLLRQTRDAHMNPLVPAGHEKDISLADVKGT